MKKHCDVYGNRKKRQRVRERAVTAESSNQAASHQHPLLSQFNAEPTWPASRQQSTILHSQGRVWKDGCGESNNFTPDSCYKKKILKSTVEKLLICIMHANVLECPIALMCALDRCCVLNDWDDIVKVNSYTHTNAINV